MSDTPMVFEFVQESDVLVLIPHGPFMNFRDNEVRTAYNEAYRLLSQPEIHHLLVDFSLLDYFGSTFVGILIRLARKVRSDGGQAVLCHVSDNMQQMLRTLMLLENPKIEFSWTLQGSRVEALKMFQSAAE